MTRETDPRELPEWMQREADDVIADRRRAKKLRAAIWMTYGLGLIAGALTLAALFLA